STIFHTNYWNYISRMCAVFNSGRFHYKCSAHFIACSLGLVFEFPLGTAIFVPSAAVLHSNTPLAKGKRQHSLAFFLSAGTSKSRLTPSSSRPGLIIARTWVA
ncbi:hypothetical protein BT96DRAFT_809200, partial [Gymnopus androsaceus JB14]